MADKGIVNEKYTRESGYGTANNLSDAVPILPGSGLAHAQDMSDRVSLSPRSSPARDTYWSVPPAASLSPPSMPLTDTMEERQIAEIAVVGELTSDTNTGKREVMDLATGIQNQLSADDEIEVHEPQDATSSHLQESSISPSKHANLPLEVKSKIVPGIANTNTSHIQRSERICCAVSEHYTEQFIEKWIKNTEHDNTITCIAALVVERKGKQNPKVVLLTVGTRVKSKCTYLMETDDANEPQWGLCDGHAVAVCYRLASFYLLTEIYKLHDNRESILKKTSTGYILNEGISLHLFTSHPPCGFFAKNERHFLSWKRPFEEKPHCLQCSSLILINAFLGIQGPLSHLFVKPIYISSITIPRYETMPTVHIEKRFEQFWGMISEQRLAQTPDSQYYFHTPQVVTVNKEVCDLFSDHFKPHIDETPYKQFGGEVKHSKKGSLKSAGTIPDVIRNFHIYTLVFSLDDGIGSKLFRDSVVEHKSDLVPLSHTLKEQRLESLQEARIRLSKALNVSQALQEQKKVVAHKLQEQSAIRCRKADEIMQLMEKCKSESEKLKEKQQNLVVSLKETKEKELDTIQNAIQHNVEYHRMYCELEGLQEMEKNHGPGSDFYLDLMGCDWARYVETIRNDIKNPAVID